jgi:RNA polymerase sigma-70 factor, ECF subfamily
VAPVTDVGDLTPPRGTLGELADEQVLAVYADPELGRARREAAFTELVDRFQRRVFAVCRRTLGGDAPAAEEATQEVFLRLARSAATFRGDAKLSTWLYAVARNVATDRVRHEARRPSTPVADVGDAASVGAAHVALAADHHSEVETAGDLAAALAELDETSRTLLLLVAVEGLSYAEAAAAVDLAVGTVKSRVSRARVRLGLLLAGEPAARSAPARTRPDDVADPEAPAAGSGPSPRGPPRG